MFTAFVFKIQANMNPGTGTVWPFCGCAPAASSVECRWSGTDRRPQAGQAPQLHGAGAEHRGGGLPGDIVGLYDPGNLRIGDTLATVPLRFDGIPRVAPEFFKRPVLKDPLRRKHLDTGLRQLSHEGVIQLFHRPDVGHQDLWLGAVGQLQYEVLLQRLQNEYNVKAQLEPLPYRVCRWVGGDPAALEWLKSRRDYTVVLDRADRPCLLAESEWPLNTPEAAEGWCCRDVEPLERPPRRAPSAAARGLSIGLDAKLRE